eukprot:2869578-Prymnesium_polylepis.1
MKADLTPADQPSFRHWQMIIDFELQYCRASPPKGTESSDLRLSRAPARGRPPEPDYRRRIFPALGRLADEHTCGTRVLNPYRGGEKGPQGSGTKT